jgi:hypothetical protein
MIIIVARCVENVTTKNKKNIGMKIEKNIMSITENMDVFVDGWRDEMIMDTMSENKKSVDFYLAYYIYMSYTEMSK